MTDAVEAAAARRAGSFRIDLASRPISLMVTLRRGRCESDRSRRFRLVLVREVLAPVAMPKRASDVRFVYNRRVDVLPYASPPPDEPFL
ncbi:MAG TPA: hypothetical protein DCQ98_18360 [Planctomycetaceae bacterium]|nr:hypothetical protein [Planctomycetaceae bacterium]